MNRNKAAFIFFTGWLIGILTMLVVAYVMIETGNQAELLRYLGVSING